MKWLLNLKAMFFSFLPQLKLVAISAALAGVVGFSIGWHEKALRVPALLEAQKKADVKLCTEIQDKLKERNDALTNERNRIAARAAAYKLQHPNTCLYDNGQGQLQPRGDGHAGVHGISTDWIRDYAALCRTHQVELEDCASN